MAVSVVAYTRSERHNYVQKLLQLMAGKLRIAPKQQQKNTSGSLVPSVSTIKGSCDLAGGREFAFDHLCLV